jgi:hypothetical protein
MSYMRFLIKEFDGRRFVYLSYLGGCTGFFLRVFPW